MDTASIAASDLTPKTTANTTRIEYNSSMVTQVDNLDFIPETPLRGRAQNHRYRLGALRCSKSNNQTTLRKATYDECFRLESCSKDPIGFDGSKWSVYSYLRQNPGGFIDPMGLTSDDPTAPTVGREKICNNLVVQGILVPLIDEVRLGACRNIANISVNCIDCNGKDVKDDFPEGQMSCDERGNIYIEICTDAIPDQITEHVRRVLTHELVHARDACTCKHGCKPFQREKDVPGIVPLDRCKTLLCSEIRAYSTDGSLDHLADDTARKESIKRTLKDFYIPKAPFCSNLPEADLDALIRTCFVPKGGKLPPFPGL